MTAGIFHIRDDGRLVEMKEERYVSEEDLQSLLANYPNLLPGRQISTAVPRRWLLIKREMGVPSEEEITQGQKHLP